MNPRRHKDVIVLDFLCFEHYFYEKLMNSSKDMAYETKNNYNCRKIQFRKDHDS
jgi:hypothetical protein